MKSRRKRNQSFSPRQVWAMLACVAVAVALVYLPGLRGPFVFDDVVNFVNNSRTAVTDLSAAQLGAAMFANESGPLGRPLSSLSFALNHYFAGSYGSAFAFKLTNLFIHLVNAVLIYWLAWGVLARLTNRNTRPEWKKLHWLALFTAAAWALHPIQLTSVLYVVQRMTSLSATFTLLGLLLYVHGRERLESRRPRGLELMSGGLVVGLFGVLAKENAALIFVYAMVVEFVLFDRDRLAKADRRRLFAFYGIAFAAPLVLFLAVLALHLDWLSASYAARDFTPAQRLLTEARVLWHYLALIAVPDPTSFTLFHDDIPVSKGLLQPWTTFIAIVALLALLAASVRFRERFPVLTFAVFWFLGGHLLESTLLGLELAHEHRNYLPSLGPIIAAAYFVGRVKPITVPAAAAAALVLALGIATAVRADTWSTEERLIRTMVRHHPQSARSHAMYADLLGARHANLGAAIRHYQKAIELAPGEPAYPLRMILFVGSNAVPASTHGSAKKSLTVWRVLGDSTRESIDTQLANGPVTPETARSLRALSRCVVRKNGICAELAEDVMQWHRAIEENSRVHSSTRIPLLYDFYELAYLNNRFDTALWAAQRGTTLRPKSIDFLLMQADAQLALKRPADAEQTIERIEATTTLDDDRRKSIDTLREKVRTQRAGQTKRLGAS